MLLSHQAGQADNEQRRQNPAGTDVDPEIHAQPLTEGQAVLGLMKIDQWNEGIQRVDKGVEGRRLAIDRLLKSRAVGAFA